MLREAWRAPGPAASGPRRGPETGRPELSAGRPAGGAQSVDQDSCRRVALMVETGVPAGLNGAMSSWEIGCCGSLAASSEV